MLLVADCFFKSTEKWVAAYCALSFLLYHSQQIFTKQLRQRLKLDAIIDDVIPFPYQGLSLGQRDLLPPSLSARLLVVGWNAYVLSEANYRDMAAEHRGDEHQALLSESFGHQSVVPISVVTD